MGNAVRCQQIPADCLKDCPKDGPFKFCKDEVPSYADNTGSHKRSLRLVPGWDDDAEEEIARSFTLPTDVKPRGPPQAIAKRQDGSPLSSMLSGYAPDSGPLGLSGARPARLATLSSEPATPVKGHFPPSPTFGSSPLGDHSGKRKATFDLSPAKVTLSNPLADEATKAEAQFQASRQDSTVFDIDDRLRQREKGVSLLTHALQLPLSPQAAKSPMAAGLRDWGALPQSPNSGYSGSPTMSRSGSSLWQPPLLPELFDTEDDFEALIHDPRDPSGDKKLHVIGFHHPGWDEALDMMCGCGFLSNSFDHSVTQHMMVLKPPGNLSKIFTNAEAAFQATRFWRKAQQFATLSGEKALDRVPRSGLQDNYYSGFGTAWLAMSGVLNAKFKPGTIFAEALIRTGDAFLVSRAGALRSDVVWTDGGNGSGKNWLGLQLMLVRDLLSGRSTWSKYLQSCFDLQTGKQKSREAVKSWQAAVYESSIVLPREVKRWKDANMPKMPRLMFLMEEMEFPKVAPKAQAGGGPEGDKQEEPTPESKVLRPQSKPLPVDIIDNRPPEQSLSRASQEEESDLYYVSLDRTMGVKLGIDVDVAEVLRISDIRDGLAQDWNERHYDDNRINPGDIVVEVNGISGDPQKMLAVCGSKTVLKVTLQRSPEGVAAPGSPQAWQKRNVEPPQWLAPWMRDTSAGDRALLAGERPRPFSP